jgi:DNA-binding beta-propeller fold protein YncE
MHPHRIATLLLLVPLALQAEEPPVLVRSFGRTGSTEGSMELPAGVAVDAHGNFYVAEEFGNRVQKFDSLGNSLAVLCSQGTEPGKVTGPKDLVIDRRQRLWVSDTGNYRLQWFTLAGEFIGAFGDSSEFNQPFGIGLDPTGSFLFVADCIHHRIRKFDVNGDAPVLVADIGHHGQDPGLLDRPLDVAISPTGEIHTVEWIDRVQIFSPDGEFEMSFGRPGNAPGQFDIPSGISVDGLGNIYVVDTINHRVQKFARNGAFILQWGPSVDKLYRLRAPIRMTFAAGNLAIVCDHDPGFHSDRVAVYRMQAPTTAVEARSWTDVQRLYRGR